METRRIVQILFVVILLLGAFIINILYSFTNLLGNFADAASLTVDNDPVEIENDDSLPENIDEHEDDVKTTGANPPGENLLPGPDTTIVNGNAPLEAPNVFTINAVNDAPVANNISAETNFNDAVDLQFDASDVDGDNLSYFIVSGASNGTLTLHSNNQVEYLPNSGFSGSDTFTYGATDGSLNSNTATASVTVGESIEITFPESFNSITP